MVEKASRPPGASVSNLHVQPFGARRTAPPDRPAPPRAAVVDRTIAGLGPSVDPAPSAASTAGATLLGLGDTQLDARPARATDVWQSARREFASILELAQPAPPVREEAPQRAEVKRRGWPRTPARMTRRAVPSPERLPLGGGPRNLGWHRRFVALLAFVWLCAVAAAFALGLALGRS